MRELFDHFLTICVMILASSFTAVVATVSYRIITGAIH
jgi:hypothetical protein